MIKREVEQSIDWNVKFESRESKLLKALLHWNFDLLYILCFQLTNKSHRPFIFVTTKYYIQPRVTSYIWRFFICLSYRYFRFFFLIFLFHHWHFFRFFYVVFLSFYGLDHICCIGGMVYVCYFFYISNISGYHGVWSFFYDSQEDQSVKFIWHNVEQNVMKIIPKAQLKILMLKLFLLIASVTEWGKEKNRRI
jgi:hypothetical protein